MDIATGSLVVGHVLGGGGELGVALDHLESEGQQHERIKDVDLRRQPSYMARNKTVPKESRTSRRLYLVDQPGGVGAQPGLVADVLPNTHRPGMRHLEREQERGSVPGVDAEDVGPAVEVRQGELDLPVEPAGPHQGGVHMKYGSTLTSPFSCSTFSPSTGFPAMGDAL